MPFVYMMFSVLGWSLFPLVSALGIQQLSIFDYILWTYVVGLIASAAAFSLMPKSHTAGLPKLAKVEKRVFMEIFVACLCAMMSFWCLLHAFSYISKASATIVFEVWLIIAIYIAPILVKKGWKKISRRDLLFSLLALAGIAFLLVPEAHKATFVPPLYHLFLPLAGGVFMAIASVIKPRVAHGLENRNFPIASLLKIQMLFSGGVVLLAIPFALLWPDKHSVYDAQSLGTILFTGIVIHTLGNLSYTMGMLRSTKANILVLWCLKPFFAVLWLWLAAETSVTVYTVLGAIFIMTSSMMMTVKADRTMSYAATMISLLLSGVYVYFIGGLGMEDYYQAISVPLFFYAILVAFMMDRLIKSDELEEQLAIGIMNFIDENAAKIGASAESCRAHILGIVTTNNIAEVNTHYRAVRNNASDIFAKVYNQLDQLALSKVRGTKFSEMFVIFIVGLLTVFSSVVFRPDNLIADGFAIVLPISVVFVFFTILDLSENRRQFYLEREKSGEMSLSRQVTADLFGERIIAAVLIVIILLAFVSLLLVKHAPH